MTYIQDKLDSIEEKTKHLDGLVDKPLVMILVKEALTDYHNHIVEILEKERQTWAKESIGEIAVKSIIDRLQDTNPKK